MQGRSGLRLFYSGILFMILVVQVQPTQQKMSTNCLRRILHQRNFEGLVWGALRPIPTL
jgi:hypothetical protein